jgi:hypothetical protein
VPLWKKILIYTGIAIILLSISFFTGYFWKDRKDNGDYKLLEANYTQSKGTIAGLELDLKRERATITELREISGRFETDNIGLRKIKSGLEQENKRARDQYTRERKISEGLGDSNRELENLILELESLLTEGENQE